MTVRSGVAVAHLRLQVACWAAMVVFAASVTTLPVCLRQVGDEFGLDLAQRGLLGSVRMGALLGALLLSGYLADRFGKMGFLAVGMACVGAGMAGTSWAGRYGGLIGAQAVIGLGAGAVEALVNPLVAELHPRNPAGPLNVTNGLFSVGIVVAALAGGEMLEAGTPWRTTLLVWTVPSVIAGILFVTRRYPVAPADHSGAEGWEFLRKPLFWRLMAAMVLAGGCEAGMTYWGASFTEHELGATARGGALTVALFGAFMAVGRFGSGGLVSRIDPALLTTVSAAGCAVATGGLCLVQGTVAAWAAFALGGLFVACLWPTLLAIAAARVQLGSTTMFALLAAAGISGCTVFPWAIGAIGDAAGLRAGVALLPAAMVVETVLLAAVWRGKGDRPVAPDVTVR